MNITIGDLFWARWLDADVKTELGSIIRQREVIVAAIDDDGIVIMPVESSQATKFLWSGYECPTAKDTDGTVIRLIPK